MLPYWTELRLFFLDRTKLGVLAGIVFILGKVKYRDIRNPVN